MKVLWTDSPRAAQRVESLYQAGQIDNQERDDLAHFIDHGWLIWPAAIAPNLIDRFAADIRGHHEHAGKFVTTDHRNNSPKPKRSGSTPDRFESLLDLYVNLPSSREVCLHPRITRFLSLVFETRPVVNQQSSDQRSNGDRVHQDTAAVAVEDPMLTVATWIALEAVRPGSGELAFYDRSHRLPHYLFKDGTKRMTLGVDDQELYNNELHAACQRHGMEYRRFLAEKGDVFFRTANLVHRCHDRTLPDSTSRLSCVTHYHPETTVPFWFRFKPDRHYIADYCDRGAYVSAHYKLCSRQRGMLTPACPT